MGTWRRLAITPCRPIRDLAAWLEQALAAAATGHAHVVVETVDRAEREYAKLFDQVRGTPGYPLGTYPLNVKI